MKVLQAVLVWLLITTVATGGGFLLGASPVGRGLFRLLGGQGYDGWEGLLTSLVGGGVGFVGGAVLATIIAAKVSASGQPRH